MGGSFGRIQSSLQWGKQEGNWAVLRRPGRRARRRLPLPYSAPRMSDASTAISAIDTIGNEIHLTAGRRRQQFRCGCTTSASRTVTAGGWGATYDHAHRHQPIRSATLNLTGKFEVSPAWTASMPSPIIAPSKASGRRTAIRRGRSPVQPMLRSCFGDGVTPGEANSTGSSFQTCSRQMRSSRKTSRTFTNT